MKTEIAWSKHSDYSVLGKPDGDTKRGMSLRIDGELVAMLFIRYHGKGCPPEGCGYISEKAKKYPLTLHRFGKVAVQAAKADLGLKTIVSGADNTIKRSDAWLSRLGFEQVSITDKGAVFLWQ